MGDEPVGFEDRAEQLLVSAKFMDCRPLWHSSNQCLHCPVVHRRRPGIHRRLQAPAPPKPLSGTLPKGRSSSAKPRPTRLSRLLGWRFIPPTVVRDGPQGVGSVQLFISHDPNDHFFTQRDDQELVAQLQRIAAFDFIANNADRKGGHCLLDERDGAHLGH